MDLLQLALIFLMLLLAVFLTITGVQVFFILRDLQQALRRLNRVLDTSEVIAEDIEKPIGVAANVITTISAGAKAVKGVIKRNNKSNPKPKRFYKRTL